MRIRLFALAATISVLAAVVTACSNSTHSRFGDAGPDATLTTVDSGPSLGGKDASSTLCTICSSDLHAVLDCDGNVTTACPPDQGCTPEGKCVPACEAARANKSTVGCDYFDMAPVDFGGSRSCFAAFIANTWGAPVSITVDRAGKTYPVSSFAYVPQGSGTSLTYAPLTGDLPAGGIAILFLSDSSAGTSCPKAAAVMNASFTGTAIGASFHISTSAPVVGYDIFPYGGGSSAISSATLLLPTSAWGDNYMSTTPAEYSHANPWIAILAQENDTKVTLSPTADITKGTGVAGTGKGVPATYTIQRGDILKFQQVADLSGTPIQANKPIGVWGGNPCADFPLGSTACDGMHQQLPPLQALGHAYVAARHRDRFEKAPENAWWRFVGTVDGTTLTFDPPQAGAPTTLTSGQVVLFESGNRFVVTSQDEQHPFYLAEYMTGCSTLKSNGECRGDPEFVNVIAPEQFLASYIFFTDPTYPTTHLVFVRAKARDGTFKDVDLDCVGNISGWKAVGTAGSYEYAYVDLVKGDFVPQGNCNNGRHEAKSVGPFGITVWGWGEKGTAIFSEAVSYAYPAGMSLKPINTVTVTPGPR